MIHHVDLFSFVFWKNWRHQKVLSKLTDLYQRAFLKCHYFQIPALKKWIGLISLKKQLLLWEIYFRRKSYILQHQRGNDCDGQNITKHQRISDMLYDIGSGLLWSPIWIFISYLNTITWNLFEIKLQTTIDKLFWKFLWCLISKILFHERLDPIMQTFRIVITFSTYIHNKIKAVLS